MKLTEEKRTELNSELDFLLWKFREDTKHLNLTYSEFYYVDDEERDDDDKRVKELKEILK